MSKITEQSDITLHFELALNDGQVVDSTFEKSPAQFSYGDGSLLPSFEEMLIGLEEGQEASFNMSPEKAFGMRNPNNIQRMPRSQFAIDIEEGMIVSFADVGKNELPGVIASIEDNEVEVDFNHPLSGRDLVFRVKVLKIGPSE
ncbi:FKBP-type peptidyl-prolyl cis-trans isomerase [Marinomonas algicola]|jgi:FKBP-type peptidyl-prolyl cis-trans isomerase SlpA|uniref:FKBP-type peptidyl-prolyl cis-trans isomerase n=1 Tax=Marinomonas algicola TaxID=2773454 RepID=UPI0017485AA7|nr:peptidylprolyl isomerase [Marinomonas algicola]